MKHIIYISLTALLFAACSGSSEEIAETSSIDSTYCECNELVFDESYNHFYRFEKREGYNGVCEEFYPNGQVMMNKNFVNGKVDGKLIEYWDNGEKKKVSDYQMNLPVGEQIYFTPYGEVMYHSTYKNGKQDKVLVNKPQLLKQYGISD